VELTYLEVASRGILTAMKLAVPILGLSLAAGFLISIFQAVTSIQEQTLTFVPKIAAILGALILFGPWIVASMVQFTVRLFGRIPELGG
jgi:flagellar biosynthetic protein FliQ